MKDIVYVQRNWKNDFFLPIAISGSFDEETRGRIRYELGKEVEWMIRMPDLYSSINLRLAKLDLLISGGQVNQFDPYYAYRRAFYEYVLA